MQRLFFLFSLIGLIACSPKTTPIPKDSNLVTKQQNSTTEVKCRTLNDLGSKKEEAYEAYILYKDLYKQKKYKEAYSYWQKAMELAPKSDGKKNYQYKDGAKMYIQFADQAKDSTEVKIWKDALIDLYKNYEECFGMDDNMLVRKATQLYTKFYSYSDKKDLYNIYNKLGKNEDNLTLNVIAPYAQLTVLNFLNKEIDAETAQNDIDLLNSAIERGISSCSEHCDKWENIKTQVQERLQLLERSPNFYPCSYYVDKYYPTFENNPSDCEIIQEIGIKLKRANCPDDNPSLMKVWDAYKTNCKKKEVKGPLSVAYGLYEEGKVEEAISKFEQHLSTETDLEKKAKIELLIAKIYYRDIKDFPRARKFALAAAKSKPNWGDPYMLIGKLYASSGPMCGPGTGWKSQIVTWPAIDKWEYAKKIDPTVKDEANKLIRTYESFMPAIDQIFERLKKEGDTFKVGCWIQENTIIRAGK